MSSRFLKSLQSVEQHSDYDARIKSELDIVNSYLSIDQWTKEQTFKEVLVDRLEGAQKLKQRLMKFYNISSHSEVVGFRCQVCTNVFDQPTALGGHMSKAHPEFKKQQAMNKQKIQKLRQSSIQKIKKEHEELHLEATGIHRQYSKQMTY